MEKYVKNYRTFIGKVIFFILLVGSLPSYAAVDAKENSHLLEVEQELNRVEAQIHEVLRESAFLQQENERYQKEAKEVEHRDPIEAERLGRLSIENKKQLEDLLVKLNSLLSQRAFLREQLGYPNDQHLSPYQP